MTFTLKSYLHKLSLLATLQFSRYPANWRRVFDPATCVHCVTSDKLVFTRWLLRTCLSQRPAVHPRMKPLVLICYTDCKAPLHADFSRALAFTLPADPICAAWIGAKIHCHCEDWAAGGMHGSPPHAPCSPHSRSLCRDAAAPHVSPRLPSLLFFGWLSLCCIKVQMRDLQGDGWHFSNGFCCLSRLLYAAVIIPKGLESTSFCSLRTNTQSSLLMGELK